MPRLRARFLPLWLHGATRYSRGTSVAATFVRVHALRIRAQCGASKASGTPFTPRPVTPRGESGVYLAIFFLAIAKRFFVKLAFGRKARAMIKKLQLLRNIGQFDSVSTKAWGQTFIS
jgi:hypothetical protein